MSKNGNGVKVRCVNNGEIFSSIEQAARYAGVNGWTMGVKMSVYGYFEDSLGRKYIRETPMKSKNIYKGGITPKVDKKVTRKSHKKLVRKPFNSFDDIQPLTTIPTLKAEKGCPIIIRQACAEKIKQMLKDKGIWDEVVQMMDYLGIDKFEIKK